MIKRLVILATFIATICLCTMMTKHYSAKCTYVIGPPYGGKKIKEIDFGFTVCSSLIHYFHIIFKCEIKPFGICQFHPKYYVNWIIFRYCYRICYWEIYENFILVNKILLNIPYFLSYNFFKDWNIWKLLHFEGKCIISVE